MRSKAIARLLLLLTIGSGAAAASEGPPADGSHLPLPDPVFEGHIGKSYADSTPDFPARAVVQEGAPNVLLILLDDVGFGQPGTFGGPVHTPNLDKMAEQGLRYNRFHTTAICSSTRAALLSGRNHHQVASGTITELSTGFPGYHSVWPKSTASVARILRDHGYSTGAWGKWHNTPDWETTAIGPFDHWPTGLGFQYFYGFQGGETSQWEPQLFRNTIPVEPPGRPDEGYHLTEDLVDDAIGWISQQQSIAPNRPFFAYFAPGAAHAPLHVPAEWIEQYKGKFDQGWDAVREQTLERQKSLGVVPADTQLTARPEEIPAWSSLSEDQKRLYSRHMEVFAGFLAHTDYHVGRLIEAVNKLPDARNTLIIYVTGDNGASAEGSMTGTLNNMMTQNGVPDTVAGQLAYFDEIGGPLHENHYPVGWAWAGSSPFQWMKRVPSHFGGTRNGMVVTWPERIDDSGAIRSQFHHVIDITPTILAAAGIPAPTVVDGIEQVPMAGVDMAYTFDDAGAPGQRTTQYFETGGHRAIYRDGWVAASMHGVPWVLTGSIGFENNSWSLYNIEEDFSQAVDLAAQQPEKLAELQAAFDTEASKYGVYPLDDRFVERALAQRPSVVAGRTRFSYRAGTTRIPEGSSPPVYQRSHSIKARLVIPPEGAEGVIVACGGSSAGYSLYIKNGRLNYDYNFFGKSISNVASEMPVPTGEVEVEMRYQQTPFRRFLETTGGPVELYVNGALVGRGMVDNAVPGRFSATETLDIGTDLGATVTSAYRAQAPYEFTGTIDNVVIEIDPTQPLKRADGTVIHSK